ncbi:hypothetical protein ACWJKU_08240 [Methylocaldum sp. MU1018]
MQTVNLQATQPHRNKQELLRFMMFANAICPTERTSIEGAGKDRLQPNPFMEGLMIREYNPSGAAFSRAAIFGIERSMRTLAH